MRIIAICLVLAGALAGTPAQAAEQKPEASRATIEGATIEAATIEDWGCQPSSQHPRPIVLIHGTFGSAQSWADFVPALHHEGYCVFAPTYGNGGLGLLGMYGTAPVVSSAHWLAAYVDRVLSATGAKKVSIVGHSQGGMMPRYYIRFLGGAKKVDELIGLAPSNHGTTEPLTPLVTTLCPACADQEAGSPFMRMLNAGHDTEPGVDYTVVSTKLDEVVTPYQNQALAGSNVTNVVLQDMCPRDMAEHAGIESDPVAWQWTLNALGRKGPADPDFQPDCPPALTAAE